MPAEPVTDFVFTPHALFGMARRGLSEELISRVLSEPQQRLKIRPGREIVQSHIAFDDRTYLVRVFVDVDRKPAEVVTAYRTSRIQKYWRENT